VSLYVPAAPAGPHGARDVARLEHLLRAAELQLFAQGTSASEAAELLAPVDALLNDAAFWRWHREGVAIFVAPGFCRILRTPSSLPERVEVGGRFVVAPLLAARPPAERFYVLALSLDAVRVLEVTPNGVERPLLPGLPESMEETRGYAGVQVHSSAPAMAGRHRGIVHGHGGADEALEDDVLRFFRAVAEEMHRLPDREAPRVLATVEEHVPLYRRVSRDPLLLPEVVKGNPQLLSDRELAARAGRVVARAAAERVETAVERLRELGDRERVALSPEAVLGAALEGRVETVFFDPATPLWGAYDGGSGRLTRSSVRLPGDQDLVDLAVGETLRHRGEVLAVPGGGPLAAVLRY
jgi:hypothetical protein